MRLSDHVYVLVASVFVLYGAGLAFFLDRTMASLAPKAWAACAPAVGAAAHAYLVYAERAVGLFLLTAGIVQVACVGTTPKAVLVQAIALALTAALLLEFAPARDAALPVDVRAALGDALTEGQRAALPMVVSLAALAATGWLLRMAGH